MAPPFTEAIHLVSSDSAGGHVKQVVKPDGVPRKNVKILSEQLTIGPCDVDPKKHVELRRAWNAEIGDEYVETFGLDELRAAVAAAGDRPVIVWATRAYADLVWLRAQREGAAGTATMPPKITPAPRTPSPPSRPARSELPIERTKADHELTE